MKEQVITPRAANRNALPAGKGRSNAVVQRPARRERGAHSGARSRSSLRIMLAYAPLFFKILLAIIAGVLIFAGYRSAASASFFQARNIDVRVESRASADDVKRIVERAVTESGVWRADLAAISTELEHLPWVKRAIVSRVLPDGLRVRVTERVPRAVVRVSSGKLLWVDEDAVLLGTLSPTDQMSPFFMRGWDESNTPAARDENQERMQRYLEMAHEWDEAHLSERISEVYLGDVRDVRVQLAGNDSQIEVRLGGRDFGKRLASALKVLDEQRTTPRGAFITRLDATLDRRVVVGFNSNAQSVDEELSSGDVSNAETETAATARERRETTEVKPVSLKKETRATEETRRSSSRETERRANKNQEQRDRKKKDKKDNANDETKTKGRPRRVT